MAGAWRKTLIYLGLVEDDELDDYGYDELPPEEEVVTAPPRRRGLHRVADAEVHTGRDAVVRAMPATPPARFHRVHPKSFNDAQEIGDKFREGHSVIMNLELTDSDLAKRVMDFASGLVYGLGGKIEPVASKVFLLAPKGVQVSAEEGRRFLEEAGFFNQA